MTKQPERTPEQANKLADLYDQVKRGDGAVEITKTPIVNLEGDRWDMPLETLREALRLAIIENAALVVGRNEERRLSACLIAIHKAPDTATIGALKSVAYDAALNCITPDVAEYQIEKRSEDEIAARNEQAEREADAREG